MKKFSLAELPHYDGGSAAILIDEAMNRCYHDMQDRPHLKKPRKVTIEIIFKPKESSDAGDLETVETDIAVKHTVPPKKARQNVLAASRQLTGLGFEPDTTVAKFDHNQKTLPLGDGDPEGKEVTPDTL